MVDNLDDFLTQHMLTEMPGLARELKPHDGLIQNLLKLKTNENIAKAFTVSSSAEVDAAGEKDKDYSLTVRTDELAPFIEKMQFIAEPLGDLETSSDATSVARIHMSDFNKLSPEIKSTYKLADPKTSDLVSLEDWHVSNVTASPGIVTFEFKKTGAMETGVANQASSVFRDILRYNILYVMLIQAFKNLDADIKAINNAEPDEKTKKTQVENIINTLTPELFGAIADEVSSTLELNFRMIAESFLRKYGQALTEDILKYYDVYTEEIPDIYYSDDVNEKVFIESLTRVYKTLMEAIDTELVGKAGEVNKRIKDKADKLKIGKLNREKIINNFLKNDVLSQKEKFVLVMDEMKRTLEEIAGREVGQAPISGEAPPPPPAGATQTPEKKKFFNLGEIEDIVANQLDFYQNAYDTFIQKVNKNA